MGWDSEGPNAEGEEWSRRTPGAPWEPPRLPGGRDGLWVIAFILLAAVAIFVALQNTPLRNSADAVSTPTTTRPVQGRDAKNTRPNRNRTAPARVPTNRSITVSPREGQRILACLDAANGDPAKMQRCVP